MKNKKIILVITSLLIIVCMIMTDSLNKKKNEQYEKYSIVEKDIKISNSEQEIKNTKQNNEDKIDPKAKVIFSKETNVEKTKDFEIKQNNQENKAITEKKIKKNEAEIKNTEIKNDRVKEKEKIINEKQQEKQDENKDKVITQMQKPSLSNIKNIEKQIDNNDKKIGMTMAKKLDIKMLLRILKDGVTEEEKEKVKQHLKERLSPDEYQKAKELIFKYSNLLNKK